MTIRTSGPPYLADEAERARSRALEVEPASRDSPLGGDGQVQCPAHPLGLCDWPRRMRL